MAWPSSIPTFTALATLPAARLNDLRDALNAIGDPWTAYSPTITASTTDPTLGASILSGRYRIMGKTASVKVILTIGTGWVGGAGSYRISLPTGVVPLISNPSDYLGGGTVRDVSPSVATYGLHCYYFSSTAFTAFGSAGTTNLSGTAPVTLAAGDIVSILLADVEIV